MPTPNWSDTARSDLKQIGLYIGREQHRPSVAAKIMREIGDHCHYLARSEYAGTARPDLGDDIRVTSYKRWIIVFRPSADSIDVLRIVDGSRDWASLF
jgi:toxin ParE1/3/4